MDYVNSYVTLTIKDTYQSNFELTSKENVDSIGVIASSAVCSQIENAINKLLASLPLYQELVFHEKEKPTGIFSDFK